MANKQSFTPDEWIKILESPVLTGMAVSAADPNPFGAPSRKLLRVGQQ